MAARRLVNLAVLLVAIVLPLSARTSAAPPPMAYAIGFDGEASTSYFGVVSIGSGMFSPISQLPASAQGIGRDSRGHLFIVDTANNLVRVHPVTGKTRVIGPTGVTTPGPLGNTLVNVFASMATGELFLMDYDANLYSVNPKTGAATLIGPTGLPRINSFRYSSSLAGDCRHLYFTITEVDENLNQLQGPSLYRIDPRTAATTLVGPTADFMPGSGFVGGTLYGFSLDTRFLGGELPHDFAIDVATGAATKVSDLNVTAIFGAVDLVDEPGKPCRGR